MDLFISFLQKYDFLMLLLMLMWFKCSFVSSLCSFYAFFSSSRQLFLKLQLIDRRFKSFCSILLRILCFRYRSLRWIYQKGVQLACMDYQDQYKISKLISALRIIDIINYVKPPETDQYMHRLTILFLIYNQMCRKIVKRVIDITQYGCGQPLLQQHMKAVNIKSLPQNFKSDIEQLKLAAAQNHVLSLSANQIRMQHRMFAILNSSRIIPGKWMNYEDVKPADYRIIVNPILISEASLRLKDFEQCPSIQGLRFHIWNPISQNYKYHFPITGSYGVVMQERSAELKGFESRVWDHEVRHLEGILALDPNISHMQISVAEDFQEIAAMHELALNLKAELRLTSQSNMIKMLKKGKMENEQAKVSNPEEIPEKITKEMKGRMGKQYKTLKKLLDLQQSKHQK